MNRILLIALAFPCLWSAEALAQHRVLLHGEGRLAIVSESGDIKWEMPWGGIHDIHLLDNGNIMVQEKFRKIVEIDPEKKEIVWSYDASKSNGNNVDMDKEMAKLAENQIRFNATIQLMMKRGGAVKSAVTELVQG